MYEDNLRDPERFGNPDDLVKGDGLSIKRIFNNLPEIDWLTKSELEISINNLIATGLVREYSGSAWNYKGGYYFVTPLLKEKMKKLFRKQLKKN